MKRKAIIFPYNAECASLVRNRELLLNHEIVACVSPIGYGLQGKDGRVHKKESGVRKMVWRYCWRGTRSQAV